MPLLDFGGHAHQLIERDGQHEHRINVGLLSQDTVKMARPQRRNERLRGLPYQPVRKGFLVKIGCWWGRSALCPFSDSILNLHRRLLTDDFTIGIAQGFEQIALPPGGIGRGAPPEGLHCRALIGGGNDLDADFIQPFQQLPPGWRGAERLGEVKRSADDEEFHQVKC